MRWWKFAAVALCHLWASMPLLMLGLGFGMLPTDHPARITYLAVLVVWFWPAALVSLFRPELVGGWMHQYAYGSFPLLPFAANSLIWSATAYPAFSYGRRLLEVIRLRVGRRAG